MGSLSLSALPQSLKMSKPSCRKGFFLISTFFLRSVVSQQLALGAGTGPGSCRAFPFRAAQVKFFWLDTFLFRLKLFRWTGTFVPQNCHVVTSMATVGRG